MGDSVEIARFGKVTIVSADRIDAKMTKMEAAAWKSRRELKWLEAAVGDARVMAEVAVDRVEHLLGFIDMPVTVDIPGRNKVLGETVEALYKYFHVPLDLLQRPANDAQWTLVRKILIVLEATSRGLSKEYTLCLYDPVRSTETALGFVTTPTKKNGNGPLDILFFRTPPDENGHVPHPHWLIYHDIHINIKALTDKGITEKAGNLARLIVHEGSHKWGNTDDVAYKHQSFAHKGRNQLWGTSDQEVGSLATFKNKNADTKADAFRAKDLRYAVSSGQQPSVQRDGKAKPLLPIASKAIDNGLWVKNADSYAFFAYRMWKRETDHGAKAYA